MIKLLHIILALTVFCGFLWRVVLAENNPDILQRKWLKVTPHVIDTLLLVSGITLLVQGQWFAGDYAWLMAKFIALLGYIGFGVMVMRTRGKTRRLAFASALTCYLYIVYVAMSKNPLIFG